MKRLMTMPQDSPFYKPLIDALHNFSAPGDLSTYPDQREILACTKNYGMIVQELLTKIGLLIINSSHRHLSQQDE